MNVVFRVDAAAHIGIGHVMRCLTLADLLRSAGAATHFVSRHMPHHLRELLAERGHSLSLLDSPTEPPEVNGPAHADWLGTSQATDARETLRAVASAVVDWIVVDHYALDWRWEEAVRASVPRLLVIDDLADRNHVCDILIDQNLFPDAQSRYRERVQTDTKLLLGPHFALLRPEFLHLRRKTRVRDQGVRRILVSLGGADATNLSERVVRAIARLRNGNLAVDVVIGPEHVARGALEVLCAREGFALHVQPRNLGELMARADLAAGAGGSTSWERCCVGLPALCVTDADNQVPIARGLAGAGAVAYLGHGPDVDDEDIRSAFAELISDRARLRHLSEAARSLVDGEGAGRVYQLMSNS